MNFRSQTQARPTASRFLARIVARTALLVVASAPAFAAAQTVTYDFESAGGFAAGSLHGQQGWVVIGSGAVTSSTAFSGTQSASVPGASPPCSIVQTFGGFSGQSIVFVDWYGRAGATADLALSTTWDSGAARVGVLRSGASGELHVFNGNGAGSGSWVPTGRTIALDAGGRTPNWVRLTIRHDYAAKRWDLFVDGTIAAVDLGFRDNATAAFASFAMQGAANAESNLDFFYASPVNPLFTDGDADGLADAWEQAHLGTTAHARGDDPGGVGRPLIQSFRQTLSPWPAPVVPSGLKVWYRSDRGVVKSPGNRISHVTDLSGHGRHVRQLAEPARQPTWLPSEANGQPAMQFDGTSQLRTEVDGAALTSGDFTMIAVVKRSAVQGERATVLSLGGPGGAEFGLRAETGSQRLKVLWPDAAGNLVRGPSVNPAAGQVQVIAATKAGAAAQSYLNGIWQSTHTVPVAAGLPAGALAVGNQAASPYNGFTGAIVEILFYDRALTSAERQLIEQQLLLAYVAPDSDSDGLPDSWESRYLGHLDFGGGDDPGGLSRTLIQSYQQSLNPWPVAPISTGLRAWFRGDTGVRRDGNNRVSLVSDLSGQGFHVTQTAEASRRPTWAPAGANGHPALDFDPAKQLRSDGAVDIMAGATDLTIIAVISPASPQGEKATLVSLGHNSVADFGLRAEWGSLRQKLMWADSSGSIQRSPTVHPAAGRTHVLTTVKAGGVANAFVNGASHGATAVSPSLNLPPAPLGIGNDDRGLYGFAGRIAEILIFNRALTDMERGTLEQQLLAKYVPADSDSDGLPDAWEIRHLGTLGLTGSEDPGNVGRTLLQSHQQQLGPWPAAPVGPGLRLWYRADRGVSRSPGNKVNLVADLSGYGHHLAQTAEPERQPTWSATGLNGKPALTFAGNEQLRTDAALDLLNGSSDFTIFAVVSPTGPQGQHPSILSFGPTAGVEYGLRGDGPPGSYAVVWRTGTGAGQPTPGVVLNAGSQHLVRITKSGTGITVVVNGGAALSAVVPATVQMDPAPVALGNKLLQNYPFAGSVAEIIVYNRALSAPEQDQVQTLLTSRYIVADADDDGLADDWELTHFGQLGAVPGADADGDGLTNLQEFQQGSSPTDYYNGVLPAVVPLVGPNGELGPDGSLSVRLTHANGTPRVNAPARFRPLVGGHLLSATPDGPAAAEIEVRTDAEGVARVFVRLPRN